VTSILNFAPTVVSAPPGVSLRKVDLAIELQILSFYQQRRDQTPALSTERRNGEAAARR
jgi:redox-sensing transcriptional repressor